MYGGKKHKEIFEIYSCYSYYYDSFFVRNLFTRSACNMESSVVSHGVLGDGTCSILHTESNRQAI